MNAIRSIKDVDTSTIDGYDSSSGKQKGYIVVKCSGSSYSPDIFTGKDTWCARE